MTETSCVISGIEDGDNLSGHVGAPSPACGESFTRVLHNFTFLTFGVTLWVCISVHNLGCHEYMFFSRISKSICFWLEA